MGRRKLHHPRRPRPGRTPLQRAAEAYRCGSCHSETGYDAVDAAERVGRVLVAHDRSCPVLTGAISDLPDTFRHAAALDGVVALDGDGEHIATIFDTEEET